MKVTVVTDHKGAIIGTVQGHDLSVKDGAAEAGILLGPGQKVHHLDVDDSLGKLKDPIELHVELAKLVPKS
jgi:hypothetical protein